MSCALESSQAADEETLPFKTLFVLGHEPGLGLRLFVQPESCHSQWNDVRNGIRRCGLQHTLLLSAVLCNCAHGPFSGAKNSWSLMEAAENLATTMPAETFDRVVEQMMEDLQLDDEDSESLPQQPADLPNLPALKNLPPFVPCNCIIVLR